MERVADIQRRFGDYLKKSSTADEDLDRLCHLDTLDRDSMMLFTLDLGRDLDKANEQNRKYDRLTLDEALCCKGIMDIIEVMEDDQDLEKIDAILQQLQAKFSAIQKLDMVFAALREQLG